MAKAEKSESPDEFLQREKLKGFDGELASKPEEVTIDKSRIDALMQPREIPIKTPPNPN
jgi:hypothetical protein